MSMSEGGSRSHATAWTIALLLAMILYVATWPVIEIKSRLKEVGKPGTFVFPVLQAGPDWSRILYRPLNSMRATSGGKNPLAEYWRFWHEKMVAIPQRESTEQLRKRTEQMRRELEMRRLELKLPQMYKEELRRKTEERMLELQQKKKELPHTAGFLRRGSFISVTI
ncbi:hypothetical protein AYO49_04830 [Verrucomicrobiaceae bacterium SCGC AG-212-N21]|nr:hypothetical protein AYO49_04830 [Verrucomicrobiaceae bacterium SCGC AG-212-N21]